MTEYDYSPAAYDRYMRTQNRVSNWVSQTKAHERGFSDPLVPSVANGGIAPSSSSHQVPHQLKSNGSHRTASVISRDMGGKVPSVANGASHTVSASRSPSGHETQRARSIGSHSVATVRPPDGYAGSQRSKALEPRESRGPESSSPYVNTPVSRSRAPSQPQYSHTSSHRSQSQARSYHPDLPHSYVSHPSMPVSHSTRSFHGPGGVSYKSYDVRGGAPIYIPAPRRGETCVIFPHENHIDTVSAKGKLSVLA